VLVLYSIGGRYHFSSGKIKQIRLHPIWIALSRLPTTVDLSTEPWQQLPEHRATFPLPLSLGILPIQVQNNPFSGCASRTKHPALEI
jgi:hypothetical protein